MDLIAAFPVTYVRNAQHDNLKIAKQESLSTMVFYMH